MILSVTFSKPVKEIGRILGAEYKRVKIKLLASSPAAKNESYFAEFYTETQVFHKKMSEPELRDFIALHAGKTFRNCVERTESEEITVMASKKGRLTELRKSLKSDADGRHQTERTKSRVLPEGVPVPFLVHLGVMTAEGKVIKSRYDKFRQINRFLEMIGDVLPDVIRLRESEKNPVSSENPLRVVDFGSGKSYLTFAVQHYLTDIKKLSCEIFGLDLKKDVVDYCSSVAQKLALKNLTFAVGDVASFGEERRADIIITLHACDTATDYALDYALRHGAKAILSVPCCQHEINAQLSAKSVADDSPFATLLKYGLIKERFAALATDAVRAGLLESQGYKVQILEFIEESATPKNLLIRAVRKESAGERGQSQAGADDFKIPLLAELGVTQTLSAALTAGNAARGASLLS